MVTVRRLVMHTYHFPFFTLLQAPIARTCMQIFYQSSGYAFSEDLGAVQTSIPIYRLVDQCPNIEEQYV